MEKYFNARPDTKNVRQIQYQPWKQDFILEESQKEEPAPICFPHLAYLKSK